MPESESKNLRLDNALTKRGLAITRSQAKRLIVQKKVKINGKENTTPSTLVSSEDKLELTITPPRSGMGSQKLIAALDGFGVLVEGRVCADIGASTGGFTEVLLERGAKKVYAIDVGHDQLIDSLKKNSRVESIEGTNARYPMKIPEKLEVITIDVSFISLRLILPNLLNYLVPGGEIICLIKPQFEGGKGAVGRSGVVSAKNRKEIVADLLFWMSQNNFQILGPIQSPLKGKSGNVEYLVKLCPINNQLEKTV